MRKLLIVLAAMVFFLSGCGKDLLDGEVTSKDVDPGYTYTTFVPTYSTSCSGNPVVCRQIQTGVIPIIYSVPTCYEIHVSGDGKDASGDTCLDEKRWNKIKVGDTYTGKDVDPKDNQEKQ